MTRMGRAAEAGSSFSPVIFSITLVVAVLCCGVRPEGAVATGIEGRAYDPLAVASFVPPQGWIRWNFWGIMAFSPTTDHEPRLTFSVADETGKDGQDIEAVMKDYVRTFSTENYTLISKEYLYMGGYSGVRLLAQGTEKNRLFGRDYLWIQEYHTPHHRVTLILHSPKDSLETYRGRVLESFRSLIIIEPGPDE